MIFLDQKNRGFTLIELLVVIAIISLLSSIVLSSLNSARIKAKDAAVISGVREFEKLLAMEYDDANGNYQGLMYGGWIYNLNQCDTVNFFGNYKIQARNICKNILSNAATVGTDIIHMGIPVDQGYSYNKSYSIMVKLNEINPSTNSNYYFCAGSSGSGKYSNYWGAGEVYGDLNPTVVGCYYNP